MSLTTRFAQARRLAGSAVICLLLVSACAGQPSPHASPSAVPAAATDPLAGSWTTRGAVTCDQMAAAIEHAGFTADQRSTVGVDPATDACPATIVIRFMDGQLTINLNGDDGWGPGPYRIIDEHTFEAGDDCDYCVRYQFELAGDELRIHVVSDEDPGGLEDRIVQTAIYESVPFERATAL